VGDVLEGRERDREDELGVDQLGEEDHRREAHAADHEEPESQTGAREPRRGTSRDRQIARPEPGERVRADEDHCHQRKARPT
jgi:hypothetical protein